MRVPLCAKSPESSSKKRGKGCFVQQYVIYVIFKILFPPKQVLIMKDYAVLLTDGVPALLGQHVQAVQDSKLHEQIFPFSRE